MNTINTPLRSELSTMDTLLLESLHKGAIETAFYALERGANPNARRASGETALHMAAKRGNAGAVNMLLQAGANRAALDGSLQTPGAVAQIGRFTMAARLLAIPKRA